MQPDQEAAALFFVFSFLAAVVMAFYVILLIAGMVIPHI